MAKKRDMEGKRLYNFELSGGNRTVRWILIGVLLVIGAVALTFGLLKALETPAGWQQVQSASAGLDCSHQVSLYYEFGAGEISSTEEHKALQVLYSDACQKAWKLFFNEAGQTDVNGLYALNQTPDEILQVDAHLYEALQLLEDSGTRALYLGPVYAAYERVFYSETLQEALENDPTTDEYTRQYVTDLTAFANDPKSIQLLLLGDNKVSLEISQAYLDFAKANEITAFLDLGWMRNAFVLDYLAQRLLEQGFTNGYFSSVDGFVRNLDRRNTGYSFHLFDKGEAVGVMQYPGAASIAFVRNYPAYEHDEGRYCVFEDGRILTGLIDPKDGMCKSATDQLVCYSPEKGCAEVALSMLSVYVTEEMEEQKLQQLTQQDIYSLWFTQGQLRYNLPQLSVQLHKEGYTAQLVTQ